MEAKSTIFPRCANKCAKAFFLFVGDQLKSLSRFSVWCPVRSCVDLVARQMASFQEIPELPPGTCMLRARVYTTVNGCCVVSKLGGHKYYTSDTKLISTTYQ